MPVITDVVIAGGGPNGLMLACELSLAGLRPTVLERLPEPSAEPKANGLLGQVVRMADHRGLHERLSGSSEPPVPNSAYFMFAAMSLDLGLLADSPVYALPVPQHRIVEVLTERATELGVDLRRGHELVGLSQDEDTVTLDVSHHANGTYRMQARYVVGADGGHSATRKLSGIGFPGISYDRTTTRTAHVTLPEGWVDPATGALDVPGYGTVLPFAPHRTDRGGFTYAPLPGHPPLINTLEWDQPQPDGPMSLDELRASIRRVLDAELPVGPPTGDGPHVLRRLIGGNTRVAERFRDGRVFLVGDAAHVYASGGGPGLNLGLQDAVNLGWKLAAEIRGTAPAGLLDSYDTERRQAATRMVMNAQAQSALLAPGSDVTALRRLFTELLGRRDTVQHLADLVAGSDVRYDMGVSDAHPLTGRFAPDLTLRTATGTVRLAELTRTARPLLLDLTDGAAAARALADRHDRLDIVTAHPRSLTPARSSTPAPSAAPTPAVLLLRPDCYVAWASDSPHPGPDELAALRTAAHRWFGPPSPRATAHPTATREPARRPATA
ncbi:FAD-dependent monooxygenase [Streptomyces sp. RS10V-4]|uniref:FAD-dependent monooxygenase n=1 Tax=Streptomyces rhizoryzae TaxID=2932493 RepID=UPI002004B102|nr:FAD-dependent monooxygenase [Streptomyces rhizoryzae]MCK7622340.1 FAD-dependent monooxygenase [Streptomyces rhizoryzae]